MISNDTVNYMNYVFYVPTDGLAQIPENRS